MNIENYSSRFGTAADGEAIFAVMEKAFKVEKDSARWHGWYRMATNDFRRFRVLEMDGKIIGVAHIAQMRFWVGSCEITHGDVGEVSVLPEFQGKGYGSKLLTHMLNKDDRHAIPVYLETNKESNVRFYERFGFKVKEHGIIPETDVPAWFMLRS